MENTINEDYDSLVKREKMYREIVENSEETVIIHTNDEIKYINHAGVKLLGASSKEEIIGTPILTIVPKEDVELIKERMREILERNEKVELHEQKLKRYDGTFIEVEVSATPIAYEDKTSVQLVFRDITQRKETQRILKKAQQEITALSAPIVPVLEGVAVMALVGSIDSDRATFLLEHIPLKVKEQNVHSLISDFSGIYRLDEMVIEYLFKISAILRLLGVRSIVTGVRPDVAQAVTRLGMDLSLIQIFGTVQQALRAFDDKGQLREFSN